MEFPVFQFVLMNSCLDTGYYQEESGSVLFTPSHQAFKDMDKISHSLLSSRLNSWCSLSPSSQERCSRPVIILGVLYWTFSSMSLSLLYWGAPELDLVLHAWPHQCWVEGNDHLHWPAANTPDSPEGCWPTLLLGHAANSRTFLDLSWQWKWWQYSGYSKCKATLFKPLPNSGHLHKACVTWPLNLTPAPFTKP